MDLRPALPLTGERTVPGVPSENYWFRRHEAAYEYVRTLVAGTSVAGTSVAGTSVAGTSVAGTSVAGTVLEVGCGEGYGASLLAAAADLVVGLDYDHATIAHAHRAHPRARFVRGNLAALPVRSRSVDVLATLQVIEHVWHHAEFLRECRRVLRTDGLLVVTTPNRLTFSPGLDEPRNLFHTREFTAAELAVMLRSCGFAVDAVLGLHAGPRLAGYDTDFDGPFADAQVGETPSGWSERLRAAVASVTTGDFELRPDTAGDVDASLDLVLLARPDGGAEVQRG